MRYVPESTVPAGCRLARIGLIGVVSCLSLLLPAILGYAPAKSGIKARIAFVGDSLAQNYWSGVVRLVAEDPCLKSNLDLGRFGRPATGLANKVYFDWQHEIRRIDEAYHPTLTVITIGLNDRQGIIDPQGTAIVRGTPNWTDKYRQQVREFLEGASAGKAIVLFVGLPVTREGYFNADMMAKNAMYAESVAKIGAPNVRYLEPWKLNASGPDAYTAYGPDTSGRQVQIRTPDGVHFTNGGDDLLGRYLLPKLVAALTEAGIIADLCLRAQISE